MDKESFLSFDALRALAQQTDDVTVECPCSSPALDAWTALPVSFPEDQLTVVGTLVEDAYSEPRYEEYHPEKTSLWTADAPIAPLYYPYNRCTVWECNACRRAYLRYVEGGGYFVDARIRRLRSGVLVNAPLSE